MKCFLSALFVAGSAMKALQGLSPKQLQALLNGLKDGSLENALKTEIKNVDASPPQPKLIKTRLAQSEEKMSSERTVALKYETNKDYLDMSVTHFKVSNAGTYTTKCRGWDSQNKCYPVDGIYYRVKDNHPLEMLRLNGHNAVQQELGYAVENGLAKNNFFRFGRKSETKTAKGKVKILPTVGANVYQHESSGLYLIRNPKDKFDLGRTFHNNSWIICEMSMHWRPIAESCGGSKKNRHEPATTNVDKQIWIRNLPKNDKGEFHSNKGIMKVERC